MNSGFFCPLAAIASASASAAASWISTKATWAPWAAKWATWDAPIPVAPPLTNTTLSRRLG